MWLWVRNLETGVVEWLQANIIRVGTVTGAYWSGEGVAKRITAAYGLAGSDEGEEDEEA